MRLVAKLYVPSDARRSDRRAADADGTLRLPDSEPIDVRVIDLSRHGFRCIATADLREGDAVRLGLRGGGDGNALVRWRRGAQVGGEFVRPLSEPDLRLALSADVVVAVAQWAAAGRHRAEAVPIAAQHPGRVLASMLGTALLLDLMDGLFRLAR